MKITPWKTVTLGIHKTAGAYRRALQEMPCYVGINADDLLARMPVEQQEVEVDLGVLSVQGLGFQHYASYMKICDRGAQTGWALCPAEVGPALRLAYLDQPIGDALGIAMESKGNNDDYGQIFSVNNNNGDLSLYSVRVRPLIEYSAESRFVFVRPRQQAL